MEHPKPLVIAAKWIDEHPYSPEPKYIKEMCEEQVGTVADCITLDCHDCPLFHLSNFREFKRKYLDKGEL